MKFDTHDFASEVSMPANHITAQSLLCFHKDPYVYYRTYVQEKLTPPPVIRHTPEMLFKYKLLCGLESFENKFRYDAPRNPSTKKPFGEDTDKFRDWCKIARADGYTPVHPNHVETANIVYDAVQSQMTEGFCPVLQNLLKSGGQAAIQTVAPVCENNCYAYADFLARDNQLCKVIFVTTLERRTPDDRWLDEVIRESFFELAFQNVVFSQRTPMHDMTNVIVVEYREPYRVFVATNNVDPITPGGVVGTDNIKAELQALNQAYNSKGTDKWRSQWHYDPSLRIRHW